MTILEAILQLSLLRYTPSGHAVMSKQLRVFDRPEMLAESFSEALKTGRLCEVEPFESPVSVARGSVVDATIWAPPLPREMK